MLSSDARPDHCDRELNSPEPRSYTVPHPCPFASLQLTTVIVVKCVDSFQIFKSVFLDADECLLNVEQGK